MFVHVKNLLYIALALAIVASAPLVSVAAQTVDLPDGSKLDLSTSCPVCNMKLEDSKLGVAAVVFNDGKVVGFDSAGDMFRYVLSPVKYSASTGNIKNMFVSEHGTKKLLDAKQAFFVIGSEVQAGMGAEVIPFSKKEDAEKYSSANKGKRVAAYAEINVDDVKSSKKMLKMEPSGGGMGGMKH
jgi:copper chaperone NosL